MTSNNLYIIPTNTHYRSSVDLLEKILHTNNDAFFYIYQDPDRPDLYYKYLSILKKNFLHYIAHKKLIIDTYQNQNINILNTMPTHRFFNQYSRYVFLNPINLYVSSFFDINYDTYDLIGIRPYNAVQLNFNITTNTNNYVWSLSTKAIQYCIKNHIKLEDLHSNTKDTESLTNNMIKSDKILSFDHVNHTNKKYIIWEDKFKLIYLIETDTELKDSYCFLYSDNGKCMNLENNIVGHFSIENNEKIVIAWDSCLSTYIKTEDGNCYALKECVKNI